MWAILLLLVVLALSVYLVFQLVDAGAAGPLSEWWFRRQGRRGKETLTTRPFEIHIGLPPMELKKRFLAVLATQPRDESTGEPLTEGPQYTDWVNRTRGALLDRCVEAVLIFRSIDNMYRETFCKFSQQQASQRAWQDAVNAHQAIDKELRDISEWAGTLLKGWDQGIIPQASQIIQQQQAAAQQQQQQQQPVIVTSSTSEEDKDKAAMRAAQKAQDALLREEADGDEERKKKKAGKKV